MKSSVFCSSSGQAVYCPELDVVGECSLFSFPRMPFSTYARTRIAGVEIHLLSASNGLACELVVHFLPGEHQDPLVYCSQVQAHADYVS